MQRLLCGRKAGVIKPMPLLQCEICTVTVRICKLLTSSPWVRLISSLLHINNIQQVLTMNLHTIRWISCHIFFTHFSNAFFFNVFLQLFVVYAFFSCRFLIFKKLLIHFVYSFLENDMSPLVYIWDKYKKKKMNRNLLFKDIYYMRKFLH